MSAHAIRLPHAGTTSNGCSNGSDNNAADSSSNWHTYNGAQGGTARICQSISGNPRDCRRRTRARRPSACPRQPILCPFRSIHALSLPLRPPALRLRIAFSELPSMNAVALLAESGGADHWRLQKRRALSVECRCCSQSFCSAGILDSSGRELAGSVLTLNRSFDSSCSHRLAPRLQIEAR